MLEAMRKGIGSWVAKVFIGLLVLSFAVWGIADIFGGYGSQTVATVGETEISSQTYSSEFRREMSGLSRRMGRELSLNDARALGLDDQVLLRLIGDAAIESQAKQFGLGIAGKAVVARVRRDPIFKDTSGQFSQQRFYQILLANGLSEQEYLERQRRALVLEQISGPLTIGVHVPSALSDAANRFRNEKRKLEYFMLPLEKAGDVPEPSEEKLREFYNARKGEFRAPEYRSVSAIHLSPDVLLRSITVEEADIKDQFERNKAAYNQPERRAVLQIPFPDESTANEAYKKLKDGADFMEIAKSRDLTEKDVDLGLVTKTGILDDVVADEIFKLPVGQLSEPIKGNLATVIAKVTKIEPAVVKTLEDVRENISKNLAAERAATKVLDLYDKIEDERAAGLTLAEIAKKLDLKHLEIDALDRSGRDVAGKPVEALAGQQSVVRAVFSADVGVETDPEETSGKGYIWYEVTKITPERQKDFSEARDDIEKAWRLEEERKLLSRKGQELVDKLRGGETISAVAESLGVDVKQSDALKRTDRVADLPNAVILQAFALNKGAFGSALTSDGKSRVVFKVAEIELPEKADADAAKSIVDTLKTGIADDIFTQYIRALREKFGVKINQTVFEEATAGRQTSGGRPAGAL